MSKSSSWEVDFRIVAFGTAFSIATAKLTVLLGPIYYFSFSRFLFGATGGDQSNVVGGFEPNIPLSFLIKFSIPFFAGILVGFLDAKNPIKTAAIVGFLSAFILAWPALIAWDRFVYFTLHSKRYAFWIVYGLYFFSYSRLASFGAHISKVGQHWYEANSPSRRKAVISDLLNWNSTLKPMFFGATGALFTGVMSTVFSK